MCLGMCSGSLGFVLFGHLLTPSFVPENRNATWGYNPPYPLRLWFGALSWTVVWLDGLDYPVLIKRGNGKLQMGVYSWENHRSKWWIFQQTTFDYRSTAIQMFFLSCFHVFLVDGFATWPPKTWNYLAGDRKTTKNMCPSDMFWAFYIVGTVILQIECGHKKTNASLKLTYVS